MPPARAAVDPTANTDRSTPRNNTLVAFIAILRES
jgi:hypothetical protein